MQTSKLLALPIAGLLLVLSPTVCLAQSGDQAAADQLFREGRQLMAEKKYAEACAKFEASQKMGPAMGTLLNLAVCHEAEGKLATAWGEFAQVEAAARRNGNKDREEFARQHLKELEPRLPKLTVRVPPAVRKSGLVIRRNGQDLAEGAWSVALPIDPGVVKIEASAPGFQLWRGELTIGEKETKEIEVPELIPEPRPEPTTSTAPIAPAPISSPSATHSIQRTALAPPTGWSATKTTGAILGGVGLLGLGVGAYFGLQAFSDREDSNARCPNMGGIEYCDRKGVELNNSARTAARLSNIGIGLGLLTLGAGAYLFFWESEAPQSGALRGFGVAFDGQGVRATVHSHF
ncbi:MAG: hypothetical protein RMJ98_05505 [Myxococcales bacterium]|nr:hypothetical protein [Polyangiaceae bacterium]MDW8248747.1 hypothetical protein [Myxococcales bacterium]